MSYIRVDRFPDAQAADGVGLEADLDRPAGAFRPQRRIRTALHDAELHLPGVDRAKRRLPGRDAQESVTAAGRPPQAALHGLARLGLRHRVGRALVEHHGDVRAQVGLDVGRPLRGQHVQAAVEVGSERGPFLRDRPPFPQAEHLVAAAVGENGPRPPDEAVEAAAPRDEVVARAEEQVVGVAEDHRGAGLLEVAHRQGLHGPARAHGHERGRLDLAVRGAEDAAPREPVAMRDGEVRRPRGHRVILRAPGPAPWRVRRADSPSRPPRT